MKGIMFKEELLQKIVKGEKTQTRRTIKAKNSNVDYISSNHAMKHLHRDNYQFKKETDTDGGLWAKPKYTKGETLYLKEPFSVDDQGKAYHKQGLDWETGVKWKNKMFMPAKHARHFIKITDVRAELLHSISREDAIAEGIDILPREQNKPIRYKIYTEKEGYYLAQCNYGSNRFGAQMSFLSLWEKINGGDAFKNNIWVWVYEFELLDEKTLK